jgi:N-acetyl-anhydromuramyl-L-alanine amidase AmpD
MRLPAWSRRTWLIVHGLHLTFWATLAIAFVLGAFTGAHYKTVFGVKLDARAQHAYRVVAAAGRFEGQAGSAKADRIREALPPEQVKQLDARNSHVHTLPPQTLATPEPTVTVSLLSRNYSSRNGTKPVLFVIHDAEMPNYPNLASLWAIKAWFNNPQAQASATWATDRWGNTIQMVPVEAKAWHVAFFNSWAVGDELIGYASQTTWPEAQLRAVAKLNAAFDARYGVPVQRGRVSGCTILRAGTVEHADLGSCGGGHHDPGVHFPMTHYLTLVGQYLHGGYHPTPKPAWYVAAKKLAPLWAWTSWRDHGHPTKLRPAQIPRKVPQAWWNRYAIHTGAR